MLRLRHSVVFFLVAVVFAPGCSFDPSGVGGQTDENANNENSNENTNENSNSNEVRCGNGEVEGREGCDDGNTDPGDGCDGVCDVEVGWSCEDEPSACSPECGDGKVTGSEG